VTLINNPKLEIRKMKIQCIDRKTFELSDSSKKLGHITYDSLVSSKANAIVGNL